MKLTRPVLRYHGGKWRIAPWIISFFPEHCTYVEPFAGAASVLLRKPRSHQEVLNDLDGEIVNLFRILREQQTADRLLSLLELTPFSRAEFRGSFAPTDLPIEKARRLVVKSFMGFGSSGNREYITGFRAASKQSNRPHALDWTNVPESLHAVTERLKGVVIECRPAVEVIAQQDAGDTLFYLDPPYVHSTRPKSCKHQYRHEMHDFEHFDLLDAIKGIQGKAVVSGYACGIYERELKDWRREDRATRSSSNRGSGDRIETLWMNF